MYIVNHTEPNNTRIPDEEPLIRCENVGKRFCRDLKKSLWYGVTDSITDLVSGIKATTKPNSTEDPPLRNGEFWANKDICFELKRGDCLALLGRNGAGKTTLLKLLNGLIKPDIGKISINGRVGALIALGAGFSPILTGRENIYVNASVLGMRKSEIDKKLDAIIDFSELESFIDTPIQNYSSGMAVRLGFSIAVHLDPDILLIDEVLAVGDAGFKLKAYNAITKIIERAAVIFVSHSTSQIGKVCNRGILLDQGRILLQSNTIEDVIDGYIGRFKGLKTEVFSTQTSKLLAFNVGETQRPILPNAPVEEREFLVCHGSNATLSFVLGIDPKIRAVHVSLTITNMEAQPVAQISSINSQQEAFENKNDVMTISVKVHDLCLNKGRYAVDLLISETSSAGASRGAILVQYTNLLFLQVSSHGTLYGGAPVQLAAAWSQRSTENQNM
jgi:lipopolysaccharide transport system ATP-binding protein